MSHFVETHAESSAIACSIIIPTRDQLEFLQPCVESIFASLANHAIEIIIVDNGSTDLATLEYLQSLRADTRCTLLDWPEPFNFSAINNFAAQQATGDILCFLNNDIEIIDTQWLDKLLPLAAREDLGALGCTLLYPDQTLQHGGIALHAKAIARHIALKEPADFFAQHGLSQPFAVDAVTAACMFVRKELFLRLGGFNATKLAVAFNDVDFCLRLGEKGLPVLLHPGVQLVHHESVSRKSDDLPSNRSRAQKEHAYMLFRWRHRLAGQNYTSGIPANILEQATGTRSLEELLRKVSANLFRDFDPAATVAVAGQDTLDSWQQPYLDLVADYENLKAHARRMEQAHRLIENSIFWRITAPLRWLKRKITREGKRPPALIGADASNKSNGQENNKVITSQTASQAASSKAHYDAKAQKQFSSFLQSTDKLKFPSTTQPTISIILVFYNQAHLSLLCLRSILDNADVPYELVIIDNNSTDATAELLDRIEHAEVVRNTDNSGFVKAVNQGAGLCRGEFILLLNNDALLEQGALSVALDVFDRESNVGAVGAKIKLLDGTLQEAGSLIWNDGACLGYGRGADPAQGEFQFQRDVDYCSGAFLLFRRATFNELGGFDEAYAPAYYEESDFCIRLQKRGLRIIYCPEVQITHYEFASSGGLEGASKLQAAHRQLLCDRHNDYLRNKADNDPDNILEARTNNNFANVLVIDDRVPHPSLGAGYPRAANLMHALSELDLNLSLYPLLFPEDDWVAVYATLPHEVEVLLGHGKPGLQKFLEQRKGFYQYILISRLHNMEYFNFVVNLAPDVITDARIIYDAEAVTAPREILKQQLFGKPLDESAQEAMLAKEVEQSSIADVIITVSKLEAATYQQMNYHNAVVIGHTIAAAPTPRPFSERAGLLFVGALRDDASPNVDSLLWFIINVLPLIQAKVPDVQLHVVGDNTAPSLATIEIDNVQFYGRMESIDSMYNASRVFVAPTRFAAGIPHKVHEAAARGLPSVTTRLLANQLDWRDGEQLLVADAAKDYAQQCVRLYQDEALWQMIRDNGLAAVAEDCSTEKFNNELKKLFTSKS